MSFTKRGDTRKCRAASLCPLPSSTNAITRLRNSTGCGFPMLTPQIWQTKGITKPNRNGILNHARGDTL